MWAELGKADLLGVALPEADGGGGYGILEACLVAEQIGRTVAPVPYLSSIVGAAMPIAAVRHRRAAQALLPGVIDGAGDPHRSRSYEPSDVAVPAVPATQATADGDGWRLDGEKSLVVGADRAAAILVPARTGESAVGVFLVDPAPPGVDARARDRRSRASRSGPCASTACAVDGRRRARRRRTRAPRSSPGPATALIAALCATQAGVCEEALAITATYVSEREQFGQQDRHVPGGRASASPTPTSTPRPSASPPCRPSGASSEGLDADDELMTAKFWAADGGQRVVHAAQHLHGGIGVDLDYPIHRYFRWAKVLELTLGGASPSLLRLGASLATQPVGGG